MIRLGLCSGSCILRDISGVVALARAAGLEAIEWSSDAHVAPGEMGIAGEAMMATLSAGLTVASYATAYRVGSEQGRGEHLERLLATAAALYAPVLRVYAREGAWEEGAAFAEALREVGDAAAVRGITVCVSPGRGTGLDRYDRALELLRAAGHPFVRLAWEDLPGAAPEAATAALAEAGRLAGLAIARCATRGGASRPAAEDREGWRERLRAFAASEADPKMGSFVLLGAPREEGEPGLASLAADADTLRELIKALRA